MGQVIADLEINRICIIDDDSDSRDAIQWAVEDSNFTPVPQADKVANLDAYFMNTIQPHDAVVSDHHLRKKNYFPVNGAEVVSNCYTKGIPAVLVTKYEAAMDEIRVFRSKIPVILNPDDFEPDSLIKSLEVCIREFKGYFAPSRKIWRTLVRVDDVDENYCYIVLPSWNQNEGISIPLRDFPAEIKQILHPDTWLHAKVNIGAESSCDLYFVEWEPK